MCILQAYFDEAGSADGKTGTFVLAGYIATENDWGGFEKRWQRLLEHPCHFPPNLKNPSREANICRPLEYLHAQEMEGLGKKRFRYIGQQNRAYLIHNSVTAIITSGIIGIVSTISLDAFHALDPAAKTVFGDPYRQCLRLVVIEAATQSGHFLGIDKKEKIAFIFEENPRFALRLHELYQQAKEELGCRYRMGTITFAEKKKFKPLQAADRFAFEAYQHYQQGEPRPELERLQSWPQHHGRYLNAEGLDLLIAEMSKRLVNRSS